MANESLATDRFIACRDGLIAAREDLDVVRREFEWPALSEFNWALDYFDAIAAGDRAAADALRVVGSDGKETRVSYGEMSTRSNQVANWMRSIGFEKGDRVLIMLGNQVELWEATLAAIKLGVVIIPATPQLGERDLRDRLDRGQARHVIVTAPYAQKFERLDSDYTRISVGESVTGWIDFSGAAQNSAEFVPSEPTEATDPLLLYFTSGTTALPKLVKHTHSSYPVGHLSTMYWIGILPGDVHLNLSSPGWAKHAWSCIFAPWNGEATSVVFDYRRFEPEALLDLLVRHQVSTFCAPPTVWRLMIQADLGRWKVSLREVVSAGEPLNPEIIETVRNAWGVTIRDGFGQTETTAVVGNPPGRAPKLGSMGHSLPGFDVDLVDPVSGAPADVGEICLKLSPRPAGLMCGYHGDPEKTAEVMRDGRYHTGDIAERSEDGGITYVGRADDVFKASDYRISPFELESVLLEHDAVLEAAVVPSPDPLRLAVPKAYVTLVDRYEPTHETATAIYEHARERLAPYKRIRRFEFSELPKTVSGKIRRVELRCREAELRESSDAPIAGEFDFQG